MGIYFVSDSEYIGSFFDAITLHFLTLPKNSISADDNLLSSLGFIIQHLLP
jgi:hypothetical protein